jgi:hypothetical protein
MYDLGFVHRICKICLTTFLALLPGVVWTTGAYGQTKPNDSLPHAASTSEIGNYECFFPNERVTIPDCRFLIDIENLIGERIPI